MNTDQKYKLLSMMGYKGPKNESLMSSFIESNPAAGAKMGQFMSASKGFNKGGMVKKYAQGGYVLSGNTIMKPDGTPHQTYGSLAEAYSALSGLNSGGSTQNTTPTTTSNTTTQTTNSGNVSTGVGQGYYTSPTQNTAGTTTPSATLQTTQGQTRESLMPIFEQLLGRQVRSFEVADYQNMTEDQVRQALNQKYNLGLSGTTQTTSAQGGSPITSTQTGTTGLPVSPTGNPTQDITALYQHYLGRNPQSNGMAFYQGLLEQGVSLEDIAKDIEKNAINERTIVSAYNDILGRAPDQAGLEFYTGLLNSGQMTIEDIRNDILTNSNNAGQPDAPTNQSPPYTWNSDDPIEQAYVDYFGRAGDAAGLAYWKEQRANGVPEADIIAHLQSIGQTGSVFTPSTEDETNALRQITDLYRQVMGRNPDQEGLNFWMNAISSGQITLAEALTQIANSPDAQRTDNDRFNAARDLAQDQRNLISSAYGAPQDLVTQQDVATIQPTEGTLIGAGTGQLGTSTDALGYTPTTVQQGDMSTATAAPRSEVETYTATTVSEGVNRVLSGLEAQTADPTAMATVQGQLTQLMEQFEGGKRPPWASGVMRDVMATMQQRGLGASSMAGMAVTQAAMEAATNIAQQDAQTYATFELQNLNNRQQTAIFRTQQRMAGLFSDQAAENAQKQFNASSINQYNQFREQLETQVSQFNANQINAMATANMDAENAAKQFNSSLQNQREQFNANNSLIVAQANANWRQNINTINTAAQNDANRDYAQQVNTITSAALDNLWQRERDLMAFAFSGSESALDRELKLLLAEKQEDLVKWQEGKAEDAAWGELLGSVVSKVFDF